MHDPHRDLRRQAERRPLGRGHERSCISTIGHGTQTEQAFVAAAREADLAAIVDIRAYPGSRHNPQFARNALQQWLPAQGVAYSWMPALGGRRRPAPDSPHVALRNPSFRAYADHMQTGEFSSAVDELITFGGRIAVMCSETVWWRCHRRLLADHLELVRGIEVVHLMPGGRHSSHRLTAGARLAGGRVAYDLDSDAVSA